MRHSNVLTIVTYTQCHPTQIVTKFTQPLHTTTDTTTTASHANSTSSSRTRQTAIFGKREMQFVQTFIILHH